MKEKLNENIITQLMRKEHYYKADDLASILGVNEKTIRRRIKRIKESMDHTICTIDAKSGQGYKLIVYRREEFYRYYDYFIAEVELNNPINRRTTIFLYIAYHEGCSKDDLLNEFYISEATFASDVEALNEYTKGVHVTIVHSADGYKIQGNEYFVRNTILRLNYDSGMVRAKRRETRAAKDDIFHTVQKVLHANGVLVNKNGLDAIVNYILVSMGNLLKGRSLDVTVFVDDRSVIEDFISIAKALYASIEKKENIEFPDNELVFLAYFLRGILPLELNQIIHQQDKSYCKAVVLAEQVIEFLENIGFERLDENFKNDLICFIYGFNIRVLLDIQKRELDYFDIEIAYSQAYFLAKLTFKEVFENLPYLSRDEIGGLAFVINKHYFINRKMHKKVLAITPSDPLIASVYKSELRHFVDYDFNIITFDEYNTEPPDSFLAAYDLVLAPFLNLIKNENPTMYLTKDMITREDFIKVSRILSYRKYEKLVQNIRAMEYISTDDKVHTIVKRFKSKKGEFYTTLLHSYVGFARLKGKSMMYGIYEVDYETKLLFIMNSELHSDEVLDLLRVAIDAIIKLSSSGVVLTLDKLKEYYSY